MKILVKFATVISMLTLQNIVVSAQPVLETGGQKMPGEWIDKDTHHKVVRLSGIEGNNLSFYFHNNPFFKNRMVYYNTLNNKKQIYTVDLKTLKSEQVTHQPSNMNGEIVGQKTGNVYYQVKDSVFSTNINTKKQNCFLFFLQITGEAFQPSMLMKHYLPALKQVMSKKKFQKSILRRASSSIAFMMLIFLTIFLPST